MPFINVKTNVAISKEAEIELKNQLNEAITLIPGKTGSWLMIGIEPEQTLYFNGDDSPCAMVEVSIFGSSNPPAFDNLTGRICGILEKLLEIEPARVYVKYSVTSDWGWNCGNF